MANEHIIGNDFQISGSLKVSQSITADKFYGDGSNLLYVTASTTWNGEYTGSAKITGSLEVRGGGVDFRLSTGVSGSFSGSFAGDGARIRNIDINGTQASGSILTGSFTGSFRGDGSQLTGVQTVWSGQYSGSAGITGSINISNTVSASIFSGSFAGDGSQLTGVVGGWNGIRSGSAGITGSLTVTGAGSTITLQGDTTIDQNIVISNKGDNTSINIGEASLPESTQNRKSIVLGHGAGKALVTGSENIFIGSEAGEDALNIQNTIAIGYRALAVVQGQDVGGSHNLSDSIAIGTNALSSLTTGKYNVAIGSDAIEDIVTGDGNTALGYKAGAGASISSAKNIYIGYEAGPSTPIDESNKLYIGNASGIPLIYGDFLTKQLTIDSTVSASIFSGSFVGDGSGITGIVAEIPTGSLTTTASFNLYTASTAAELGILSELINSSNTGSFTGSFEGSFAGDGSQLTGIIAQIATGSLLQTGSFNQFTSSLLSQIALVSSSIAVSNTGSFTGSFVGDGSQLTGLVSSGWDGRRSGSAGITGSLGVTNAITASTFTGSFRGDGSQLTGVSATWNGIRDGDGNIIGSLYATNAITASVFTGSFIGSANLSGSFVGDGSQLTGLVSSGWDGRRSGSAGITGSLTVTNTVTASTFSGYFTGSANLSGSFRGDGSQLTGLVSSGWDGIRQGDASITGSLQVVNAITASAFTGSFRGSFIGNGSQLTGIVTTTAVSASFARTASLATTASYANFAQTASEANFAQLAGTTLFTQFAATSSIASQAISASFATTASYVAQADFATTTLNVLTASVATTASYALTAESATIANRVVTTNNPDGTSVYYVMFTNGVEDNSTFIDSDTFTYSANTNTLNVTASYATLAQEVQGTVTVGTSDVLPTPQTVGQFRYRNTPSSSYVDMVMQTDAVNYTWVNIVENNW